MTQITHPLVMIAAFLLAVKGTKVEAPLWVLVPLSAGDPSSCAADHLFRLDYECRFRDFCGRSA
jgi:hypothetical protein